MQVSNPLSAVLACLLLLAMGFTAGWYWSTRGHIDSPADVTLEAREDSIAQAEHVALGDSLRKRERTIQQLQDSLDRNTPPPTTQRDDVQAAMASEPMSVHVDSLDADPIR